MAAYVETKVMEALSAHLGTLALSPAMPIAWSGVDFEPPDDGYLRASHLPNTTQQISLGETGLNRHQGLIQVDVMWPESLGLTEAMERAGAIVAHFKRGTDLTREGVTVRIVRPPSVAPALRAPPFLQVPVTIAYLADAANPS